MTNAPIKSHVFYTDGCNGWCSLRLDENDFQVGEAEYCYHKVDAVASAKAHGLPVHVFHKWNGEYVKTINP